MTERPFRHWSLVIDSSFWLRTSDLIRISGFGIRVLEQKEQPKMANANKQYEGMFLFPAGASAELEKAQTTVRSMIERHGGSILVLKKWDERKLAYELDGQKRGVYIIAYFTAPGTTVAGIERDVNLSEEILRVLVTDASHLNQEEMEAVEPQPIIKEERPSWDRGFEGGGGFGGPRGPRREEAGSGRD